MALLPITQLENHPVGTTGLNGIVNSNWSKIETLYSTTVITPSATPAIDFLGAGQKSLALAQDVTFSTSNRLQSRRVVVLLTCDGTLRNFTFPAWVWVGGAAPASIAASKRAILELWCTGTTEASVWARYTVEI